MSDEDTHNDIHVGIQEENIEETPIIFSVGHRCTTASLIKIMKMKFESYPFDWVVSKLSSVQYFLENDFENFLNKENYTQIESDTINVINDEININNRTREISQNIRCLVCQNQSIDESNSELAKDLKILIREKVIDGVSNEEIYGYLRERYGDYILLKPPLNLNTTLLWFLPFIVLIFGSILIFKIIKSNQK